MLACVGKTLLLKFIGVASGRCIIVMCCAYIVLSSLCSLQAYNYAEHLYNILALNYTSPPTHFTQAPPSPAKNRYMNSRLMILHASELTTELFDESLKDVCLRYRSRLQSYQCGRVTCMVLRVVIVKPLV